MSSFDRALLVAVFACSVAGCGITPRLPRIEKIPFVHRIDIEQGNIVTQEMLAQLKPGMEKSKVRYIMGSPLIVDTFHTNRWDYVYSLQEGGGARSQRRVSLYFEADKLARIEGNIKAAEGPIEINREPAAMVEVPGAYEPSIVDRLKSKVGLGDDLPQGSTGKDAASSDEAAAEATPDDAAAAASAVEADATADAGSGADAGTEPGAEAAQAKPKQVAKQSVVVPKDAPTRKPDKRGFFRRLWDKIGGDEGEPPATGPRTGPDRSEPNTGGEL